MHRRLELVFKTLCIELLTTSTMGVGMLLMCLAACSAVAAILVVQNPANNIHIITPDELMEIGLKLGNYSVRQTRGSGRRANVDRFRDKCGSNPLALCQLWEDLQTTSNDNARIDPFKTDVQKFLSSMFWIKKHPTELDRTSFCKSTRMSKSSSRALWTCRIRSNLASPLMF